MRNWTIGKRLAMGFGSVVMVTAALGVYTVNRLSAIERQAIEIRDSGVPGLAVFSDIKSLSLTNASLVLRIALSEDEAEIAAFEKVIADGSATTNTLFAEYE